MDNNNQISNDVTATEPLLLALTKVEVADGDAIAKSRYAISQCLEKTAQEILQAEIMMQLMANKTHQLTKQMEMVEQRFNSAYIQFSKACDLHHEILDHSLVDSHKEQVLAQLTMWAELIQQMIQDEGVVISEWPIEKVHNIISVRSQSSLSSRHPIVHVWVVTDVLTAISTSEARPIPKAQQESLRLQ